MVLILSCFSVISCFILRLCPHVWCFSVQPFVWFSCPFSVFTDVLFVNQHWVYLFSVPPDVFIIVLCYSPVCTLPEPFTCIISLSLFQWLPVGHSIFLVCSLYFYWFMIQFIQFWHQGSQPTQHLVPSRWHHRSQPLPLKLLLQGPGRPPARPQKAFWAWSRLVGNPRVWSHRGLTEACEECTTVVKTKAWISLSELI